MPAAATLRALPFTKVLIQASASPNRKCLLRLVLIRAVKGLYRVLAGLNRGL